MDYENTPLASDWEKIKRQREIADVLAKQSLLGGGNEMVSGRVIPGWSKDIGRMGKALVSGYSGRRSDEQQQALSDRYDANSKAAMDRIVGTLRGREGVPPDPTKAALDASVDPDLRGNKSVQSVIDAMIKADAVKQGRGGALPYQFIPTTEGIVRGDRREGVLTLPENPFMRATDDPVRQGEIAAAREGATQTQKDIHEPGRAGDVVTSKALAEREAEKIITKPKVESALAASDVKTDLLDDTIDQAIDQTGAWTAGFLGSATSWVPGTPAHNLENTLSTVKSNIGFDKLQEMRNNSPTGGALGQVSEFENKLLQSVWGALEQSQSPGQLKENLEKVRKQTKESWDRVKAAYKKDYGVEYGEDLKAGGMSAPEGVDKAVWDVMTPEERKLWQ